jgi:hypothetical protein
MALQRRVVVIAYTDGRQERYPLRPAVEMEFERVYKVGLTTAFTGEGGATNLYRLAWLAEKSRVSSLPLFENWINDVEVVDVEVEEIAPFVADQPAGGSHNSASRLDSVPAS